jgi:predicted phage tail protein|tara:strand:+ start:5041 stop:8772 length:3732 start_codon:yes stop_codon:yes gene_type:complete
MVAIRGAGGTGCFTGDTLVSVPGGSKPIEEIKIGDIVCSFDDKGKIHEGKVLKVHKHENERAIKYTLWGGKDLNATPNHWVLNQYNAFVEIDTLGSDDCLVDEFNHLLPIVSRTELGLKTVYNLTVEGHHTFIANTIRVHNAGLGLKIVGSGGGGSKGGGGGTPEEEPDTLQSVQFATVLDVISEGEIEGIEDGVKGIFLNDTPVQDAGGNNNFQGYTIVTRDGTQSQSYIPNLPGGESEKSVGVAVTNGSPITRSITDTDVDRVRVTISVPSLRNIEDDGDIRGTSVSLSIQLQYNSGGFTTVVNDTISGKTSDNYQRDYMLTLNGAFPVDVRVVRNTADSTSTRLSNATNWFSYTEIIDEKLRYPNTALAFLKFDARQFSNIPQRKYLVRGVKVRIPHNATVDTTTHLGRITYSGLFNGTLGAATWTNDPAWLLYALLTDTRWGAGIPESSLDVFDFYNVSTYCNALVPDGRGGQEPRFSCNMVINTRKEVYAAIQELTSLFRGIAYYGAGTLVLNQDRPTDSRYQIGPSNVVNGDFVYSGSSLKSRHTCATVAYQSYASLGEVQYEYVELADQVAKYGVINKEVRALGCYSQGQAHRLGKWLLLTEANLTQTVSFAVSLDSGLVLRPGVVIDIADPVKAGTRRSGRISSATATQVTIDSTTDLSVNLGNSPTISVMMPTGLVETRTIGSIDGAVVTVSSAFSEAPNAASVYLIQTTDVQSNQFRVISVAEGGDGTYGVTAVEYNESIYAAVEQNLSLTQRDISNLSATPDPVANIVGSEYLYQRGQGVFVGFDLSWISPRQRVNQFRVSYRIDNDNFQEIDTSSPSTSLLALRPGTLEVRIQAINFLGKGSRISSETFELVGKTAVPGDVQNLSIEPISANTARLKWNQTLDLDVKVGGKVHIRHSSLTDGTATFSNSVDLINAIPGAATDVAVPLLEGEYILKFADDGGRLSTNDASVLVDIPDSLGQLLAENHREDQESTPFPGTKTNCFYSDDETALTLQGSDKIDDVTDNIDDVPIIDFLGDIESSGTYLFQDTVDLGIAFSSIEMRRHFVTRGFFPSDRVDARTALIDTWEDIDGGIIQNVNAELYVRSTNDDPGASPTYGDWVPFNNGSFKGRAFQFKAELTSSKVDENILIDQMGYQILVNPRVDQIHTAIASGTSTKSVTFQKPFFVGTATVGGANAYLPSVGVVVQNLGDGERVNISNVSATGFDLDVLDSGGSNVSRSFTYTANGYGRGI